MKLPRFLEQRAEKWLLSRLASWSDAGIGAGPTAAGIEVTPERALSVPAVAACVSVLSQDVARTPLRLRRRIDRDTFEDAVDHPLYEILHDLSNPETTAFSLKLDMMRDLLTHERAYAEIVRVDGRVVALWRIDPTLVHVDRDEARRKRYRVTLADGRMQTWLFDPSRPPILELLHPSPIHQCRELIGTALALQTYVGKFFSNGARLGGVLQTDGKLAPEQAKAIRESFSSYQQGAHNAFRIAVLEQGLKYASISAPNSEAQLNETQAYIRTELAGAFRISPFKVGDLSRANYSNVEALAIEHATGALDPYFQLWESAVRRDLLTTRQFGRFEASFDRGALIRADVKSLHEALARGRDSGYYTANDIRRKLGDNPLPADTGADLLLANGNLAPLTGRTEQEPGS